MDSNRIIEIIEKRRDTFRDSSSIGTASIRSSRRRLKWRGRRPRNTIRCWRNLKRCRVPETPRRMQSLNGYLILLKSLTPGGPA